MNAFTKFFILSIFVVGLGYNFAIAEDVKLISDTITGKWQYAPPEEEGIKEVCFIPIPFVDDEFLCGEDIIILPKGILKVAANVFLKKSEKVITVNGLKYSRTVIEKALAKDFHDVEESVIKDVLKTTPATQYDGYKMYRMLGEKKGNKKLYKGTYEVGVTKDGYIDHIFFRPKRR